MRACQRGRQLVLPVITAGAAKAAVPSQPRARRAVAAKLLA